MKGKTGVSPFLMAFMGIIAGAALLLAFAVRGAVPVAAQGQPPVGTAPGCWVASAGIGTKNDYQDLRAIAAISDQDVWAAGTHTPANNNPMTLLVHWDGKAWSQAVSPSPGNQINTLTGIAAITSDNVWAVGYYGSADSYLKTLVLHWDGKSWSQAVSPSPGGFNNLTGVAGVSASDVWAVGYYVAGATEKMLILHFDGTVWAEMDAPEFAASSRLNGIAAVSKSDVWAVGYTGGGSGTSPQSVALHWNGSKWENVPTPALPRGAVLSAVSAAGANDAWAVGLKYDDATQGKPNQTLTMRWNGTQWSVVQSPNAELDVTSWSSLNAVTALPGGEAWAFGFYNQNRTPYQPLFMQWKGAGWGLVSSPVETYVTYLYGAASTTSGTVWVVGSRTSNTGGGEEGLVLRHTTSACASPTPAATMTPPVALPGSGSVTFPETGKTVSGIFLDYWNRNGGLAQQGFPITSLMGEVSDLNGKTYTMQYFERAVFEYHPENQAPYNVLLSQLGTFEYKMRYGKQGAPNQQPNTEKGSVLVPETGKRLGGRFLQYWQQNGGLPQQGYPISEEFQEVSALNGKTYTVQYFERAVFELHPENQPPYDVLLSHLGKFRNDQQYNSGSSAKGVPGAGNVGNVVAGGKYVVWSDAGLPNNPIYAYDTESGTQTLVTDAPGFKNEVATDGTVVVWLGSMNTVTLTVKIEGLNLSTGKRFNMTYSSTAGVESLAIEKGTLYYYRFIENGVGIFARDIDGGNERLLLQRNYSVQPDGSRIADAYFDRLVVKDGTLVWGEVHYNAALPPTKSEWSLHMLKLDGSMGDTVLDTGGTSFSGFGVSGDNVAWSVASSNLDDPPDPNSRVSIYNVRTGVKKVLSRQEVRGMNLVVSDGIVAWAEGTDLLAIQSAGRPEVNAQMKVYDIASDASYTLFRQSVFIAPRAVLGGKTLVYVQYDGLMNTTRLFFENIR